MRDDLIARLPVLAAGMEREAMYLTGTHPTGAAVLRNIASELRTTAAALTAQGETAHATDHAVARTKLREWVQEDAEAAQGEPASAHGDHVWVLNEHPGSSTTWHYCRRCGVVQRADGGNKPCPGKHPPITLREEAAPSPLPAAEWLEQLAHETAVRLSEHVIWKGNDRPWVEFEAIILTVLRAVAEGRR